MKQAQNKNKEQKQMKEHSQTKSKKENKYQKKMKGNRNRRKQDVLTSSRSSFYPFFSSSSDPHHFSCQSSRRPYHNSALYETKLPVDDVQQVTVCAAHTSKYTHPNPNPHILASKYEKISSG